jgi:hypothetical protein
MTVTTTIAGPVHTKSAPLLRGEQDLMVEAVATARATAVAEANGAQSPARLHGVDYKL